MKILLLSAYDADSHKRWREGLVRHCDEHEWTCLSLPPRYFNWRMRGNSLSWAFSERAILTAQYDLLVVTSMVDLSALRGFIPPLGRVPTLVYFHENQFDYPCSKHQNNTLEPQILSLYSALCADQLVFNSHYNKCTFLSGVQALLKKLPDHVPEGIVEQLSERSRVLAVPLEANCFQVSLASSDFPDIDLDVDSLVSCPDRLILIWNHRWEYDKGPERLLQLVLILIKRGFKFRLHVVGQQFRQQPVEFDQIKQHLQAAGCLGQWGYIKSGEAYRQLLCASHAVLSTALHDFQGLAVLEAVAAGCLPLVPCRQAYPEWFSAENCYASFIDDIEREAMVLADVVCSLSLAELVLEARSQTSGAVNHYLLKDLSWSALKNDYQRLLLECGSVSVGFDWF